MNYGQPFRLPPNRVWRTYIGGKLLDQIEGKEPAEDSHLPEDWIGSATRAVNPGERPPDEGIGWAEGADGSCIRLDELFGTSPEQTLGRAHVATFGSDPKLLVKVLDSADRLHIQAHPTAEWSRERLGGSSGKTEAWWVLDSRSDDSWVILGFQRPPAVGEWRRILERQDLDAMMACFDPIRVSPGDVLLVNGGVPHAVGAGLLLVEVQEPTDYVVRCEYAHGGLELPESARTMGLGVERVLDIFDYTAYPADEVKRIFGPRRRILRESSGGSEELLLGQPQTDRFEVRETNVKGSFSMPLDDRFSVLTVLDGKGEVVGDGAALPINRWDSVLLPAALQEVRLRGELRVARCLPPIAGTEDALDSSARL